MHWEEWPGKWVRLRSTECAGEKWGWEQDGREERKQEENNKVGVVGVKTTWANLQQVTAKP